MVMDEGGGMMGEMERGGWSRSGFNEMGISREMVQEVVEVGSMTM